MIRDDTDPSLCSGEPALDTLDDGFSPPSVPQGDAAPGNPTRLPVEPEFGPQLPAGEPEDPGTPHPHP